MAFIDGDIGQAESWTVWSYGSSPLPHYQLGAVKFDVRGDLWVSAISEGMVRISLSGQLPGGRALEERKVSTRRSILFASILLGRCRRVTPVSCRCRGGVTAGRHLRSGVRAPSPN